MSVLTVSSARWRCGKFGEWIVGGGDRGGEDSVVGLGEDERGPEAVFGGEIAVAVGDALDQAVDAESPQVVGGLSGGDGAGEESQQRREVRSQVAIGETPHG